MTLCLMLATVDEALREDHDPAMWFPNAAR